MTRKTRFSIAFLSITAMTVGWELVAVANPKDDLEPWTYLIVDHVPAAIAMAVIAILVSWLPGHFMHEYSHRRGKHMIVPATPESDAPGEPLLATGSITAAVAAAIALFAAFGLPLTDAQTQAVVALVALVAPLVVAILGRRKVFAPLTVRAMVVRAAQTGNADGGPVI